MKKREHRSDEELRVLIAIHKRRQTFDGSSKGFMELNLAIYKVFPSYSVIACLLLRHYCWIQYCSTLVCFRSADVGLVLIGWDVSVVNGREGTGRSLVTPTVHRFVYRQKTRGLRRQYKAYFPVAADTTPCCCCCCCWFFQEPHGHLYLAEARKKWRLLYTRWWTYGFRNMWGISGLAGERLALTFWHPSFTFKF